MRVLAILLRALAALLRLLPLKRRVAFLSRQSSSPSLDYRLLVGALRSRLPEDQVVVCLTEPETRNVAGFALGTVRQLYYACTSKVIVVDGYIPGVSIPKKDPRVCVIQTWHALGAIKKFGYQCLDTPAGRSSAYARAACMHRNYDYVLAGGHGAVEPFAQAFGYPTDQVLALGLPRIDYLLDERPGSSRAASMKAAAKRFPYLTEGKRIVLYAPTLRRGEGYAQDWLEDYVRALAEELDDPDALLVVAAHPLTKPFGDELLRDCPTVRRAQGVATINLLGFADEVVTDYSAVAYEAGLLGKPVRFFTPDLERYQASPGLNVDLDDVDAAYFERYFEGIGPGVTQRICDLIVDELDR